MEILDAILANGLVLLLVALLAESVTEVIKNVLPKDLIKDKATYILSLLVGIVLSFTFKLNIFGLDGYGEYVSIIFAGLLAGRGANYVNGFMKKFEFLRGNDNK